MQSSSPSRPIPSDTIESDVVHVIDRTALIENILNQIIVAHCRPRAGAHEFMWSVVLDTSVMSLGAKLKVVSAVAQEAGFKINRDALYKVVALRNAFAHHASDAFPVLKLGRRPEDMTQYNLLAVLEGSGKLQKLERHKAYATFNASYRLAQKSLVDLKAIVVAAHGDA